MSLHRGLWLALAWGCSGGKDPDPGDPPELPAPDDPPIDTTVPIEPNRPDFACFADMSFDDFLTDGGVDGTGFQGYDEANPTWLMYADYDLNGNGLFDYLELYERDASGNVTRFERQRQSAEIQQSTYDERGNQLTYSVDLGADGTIDGTTSYTYDALDFVIHSEEDEDGDGEADLIYDYERDETGLLLVLLEDDNGDGEFDLRATYTYDEMDRATLVEIDENIDDVIDVTQTTTYTDPVLRIGHTDLDIDVDGVVDQTVDFEYDAEGREVYTETDTSPEDEGPDSWERTTYDAEGRVTVYQAYIENYGDSYEYEFTYTFDELGRQVQETLFAEYLAGQVFYNEQTDYTFGGSCP